jgi:hypothetical protein
VSRLIVASLVLLATIGALVGAAAWNRSGDVQSLELTERELWLPWTGWRDESDEAEPNLRLRIHWQPRDDPQDARLWLTDAKLEAIGFSTGVPAGAPEAEEFYGRSLPRVAWVAFEFDGPAWRQMAPALAMTMKGEELERQSRLVPIDAGPERAPLVDRHRGGPVIVLPAILRMRYRADPQRGPSVWGAVDRLAISDVSVPLALRAPLRQFRTRDTAPFAAPFPPPAPRYRVRLQVGPLGAWAGDVK